MYAELSSTAKEDTAHSTVEQFLNFHNALTQATLDANSLHQSSQTSAASPELPTAASEESLKVLSERQKLATSWVNAALSTDLSPFSLYTHKSAPAPFAVVLNGPKPASPKPQQHAARGKPQHPLLASATPPCEQERARGAEGKAELARTLKEETGKWFLKYVGRLLDADATDTGPVDREKVAGMMSQLKNVNDWLDGIKRNEGNGYGDGDGDGSSGVSTESVSRLRKKIYEYLLTHVESAAIALGGGGGGGGDSGRDRQVWKR